MNQELDIIYAAIDEVNASAGPDEQIAKTTETPLLGSASGVDSLAFVNLVVAIEQEVESRLKKTLVLVTEETMTSGEHPFLTVGTLAKHLSHRLKQ